MSSAVFTETEPTVTTASASAQETASTAVSAPTETAAETVATETEPEVTTELEPAATEVPPPDTEPVPTRDTTAPSVEITAGPPSSTESTTATFEFAASELVTFLCAKDGGATKPCASPTTYKGLASGLHTFELRAVDDAGNGSTTMSWGWLVEEPPATTAEPPTITEEPPVTATPPALPDLVITSLTDSSVTVANLGTAAAGPFYVELPASLGTFYVTGGLAPGETASRTWTACISGQIEAIADAGRQVAESSESNNSASTIAHC